MQDYLQIMFTNIRVANNSSFCRQIWPVCILLPVNQKQMETFGALWLEIIKHEKVFYRFIAPGFLVVLFYRDRNHVKCLLSE